MSGGGFDALVQLSESVERAVGQELFAGEIANLVGVPPVTARDVRNAPNDPQQVINRFLGIPLTPVRATLRNVFTAEQQAFFDAVTMQELAQCGTTGQASPGNPCIAALTAQREAFFGAQRSQPMTELDLFGFAPTTGGGVPPGTMVPTGAPTSILGSIASAIPALLTNLAQAGVIRGSVGQALAPTINMSAAGMVPSTALVPAAAAVALPTIFRNPAAMAAMGSLGIEALQALGGLFGGSGGRGPVDGSALFRMRPGGTFLPARQQVVGPDGSIYVIANLGRATRGSREQGVMRSLARQNGFTVTRRGSGRRRPR